MCTSIKIADITETGFYVLLRSTRRPEMVYIVVNEPEAWSPNSLTFTSETNSTPARVERSAMPQDDLYIKIESLAPAYQDWRGDRQR